ncbi:MAG: DUF4931 domain-containing protein [Microthrixaceae bacterium]
MPIQIDEDLPEPMTPASEDSNVSQPRFVTDPLTGRETVVVASRQSRPNLPDRGCPFCPGGLEAPEPYETRWFTNRWPALGDARCEVVLYSPEHHASFWSLGVDGACRVIDLWAERTRELGSRDDVDYVLIFENRGPEVGATIAHPHGQIYAFADVPPAVSNELDHGSLDLPPTDDPRVVSAVGDWVAWIPDAATYPYEMRIGNRGDIGSLTDMDLDRVGLASVLVDVLARLDQFFDEPTPYMLWIHQTPTDGKAWPSARLHFHIVPLRRAGGVTRFVAAAELGAEVYFNPVEPERAARDLRTQPGAL